MKYFLDKNERNQEYLKTLIANNPNIKFCSLVCVDLGNNRTDERIPIQTLIDDFEDILHDGIQTDGSSVMLPIITSINDAKVEIIPDPDVKWYIDYSNDNTEFGPTGTLMIPSFLYHHGECVGSRGVLKRAVDVLEREVKNLDSRIEEVIPTVATELEFWVYSPFITKDEERLFVSQELKEQYWKRPNGDVRLAMEDAMMRLHKYGLSPEMCHKEVGGILSQLQSSGSFSHMEQIEIDWKYDSPLQALDNEWLARNLIYDTFISHGLDVTFRAKPIHGVAGSGEHHHLGLAAKIDGKVVNLFTAERPLEHFLSPLGFGALMGILKNYSMINLFVSSTNDAFKRLTPGFEAPVSTVCSLGISPSKPTRNRTVLIGLVREIDKPYSTRFELRAPNPKSNSYLLTSASLLAMLDGMQYSHGKKEEDLTKELSKSTDEVFEYLNTPYEYRTEEDIFLLYSHKERERRFGKSPATVYELIELFTQENRELLQKYGVFSESIIDSYMDVITSQWVTEIRGRLLPEHRKELRKMVKKLKKAENTLDKARAKRIYKDICRMMKDDEHQKSEFTLILEKIHQSKYAEVSKRQILLQEELEALTHSFHEFRENLLR